ncbi:tether containing UBX domain for GLUT4-like [Rhopilema esculentum]|uniref:tether containing UBX domain for GLUT4-like n=1 Tax=Rhopilema esculentum TaxID=499914 RepID=UPI0031DF418F
MSANKILEVLCLNGRRQKVKISSSSSILQVLQEVCKKQGFNEAEVDLIYHRKVLDVTNTMRYTNIPNNAKLEMIKRVTPRKATNVNVALQTDFDQRLQHEFSPSLTLYEILEHWESNSEGIYKGKIICKVPVVIHMTQEICGIKNLKDTTLESLGLIRGNIVLRLVHREEESCGTCSLSEDSVETAKVRQEQQKVFIRSQDQAQPSKPTNVDVTTSGCNVLESAAQTSQSSAEVSFQKENSVEPSQKRPKLQEESSVEKAPDVGGVPLAEALKDEDIHRVTQTVRPFQQFKVRGNEYCLPINLIGA